MRLLISLALIILLIPLATATDANDDEVTYSDFTLNIGDRIEVGDYRVELIEIQSIRDGLAVMRVSKVGGALDEQRAFLQNSANNFDGGSDDDGITITMTDILDDHSAKVRIEYKESLGTAKRRISEKPAGSLDVPVLSVQKSFDKNQLSVGDDVKVTVTVKNIGTGQALSILADDSPPLPEFSYVAGYPPKIKDTLDPGESDSAVYIMNAVREGSIRVPAIQVSYVDSKKKARSNNSEPFNVLINPKSTAELALVLTPSGPITVGESGVLNISLINQGKAAATRVQLEGEVKPSEGLDASGLDKSFFEIPPGAEENYSSRLTASREGNYTITVRAAFQGGDGAMIREGRAEVVVREREYKYLYLLLVIPFIIIAVWVYKRYREYKY